MFVSSWALFCWIVSLTTRFSCLVLSLFVLVGCCLDFFGARSEFWCADQGDMRWVFEVPDFGGKTARKTGGVCLTPSQQCRVLKVGQLQFDRWYSNAWSRG